MARRTGAEFDAVVVREANGNRPAVVFIADPPVLGPCAGRAPLAGGVGTAGHAVAVRRSRTPARERAGWRTRTADRTTR
ncbi:hypothetical protein [Nocardia abscessus]|uniref:hypothetical protein n=1 Tax=Nocardia abscessus TaxID=120957 RepID=UPI002458FF53|nr:hypothetical protein [Nocardia abscessus]